MDLYASHPAIDPEKLDRLAEVAVNIGVQVQPGQGLIVTAPLSALPLVRRIVEKAYAAGARHVQPILSDEDLTLARYRYGTAVAFDGAPAWLFTGMARGYDEDNARLAIYCDDPLLLAGQDPALVARAYEAHSTAYRPSLDKITGFEMNWSIVSYPSTRWARSIFPELSEDEGVRKLADAIFAASRADAADPHAAWAAHNAELRARWTWLNEQNFRDLHFKGPGTDLMVGLADGHRWKGGASMARNGRMCVLNVPTEEVLTTPHAARVDGHVAATKPLAYNGTIIRDIAVTFENGLITSARASQGESVFHKILDTDAGSRSIGEVALVPHSSPISKSGILFCNTLFDENAASHIAIGQCYADCFFDADGATREELATRGGNISKIHIDWMIGSNEVDVDGIRHDGSRVPVMRQGEYV